MKVQKVSLGSHRYTWFVLDDNYLPIQPIAAFLRYLTNVEKPANTVIEKWPFTSSHKV